MTPLKERPVWKRFVQARTSIIALCIYIASSLAFTYPVAITSGKIPGLNGDVFWYLWDMWWFKKAVLCLSNPYHTPYVFYPTGVDLAFSEISPFNAAASIPLQMAFGLIGAYEIVWISTFVFSGFGAFLLARYLVGDAWAAFVSGLIFAFCPYRFAQGLGHLNLITTQWIPFYILFFIKAVRDGQRKDALYSALFLVLVGLSSYYYLAFLAAFSMIYLLYRRWVEGRSLTRDALASLAIGALAFAVAYLPFAYPLLRELVYSKSSYVYQGGFEEFSADLIGFLIPPAWHPAFGGLVAPVYSGLAGNVVENTIFAGYAVLFLSALAMLKVRSSETRFWGISAAVFMILSLGPVLHINGCSSLRFMSHDLYLPLPYSLLMHIPVFSILRAPARWDIMMMLCLALLAGYGLKHLFRVYGGRSDLKMLAIAVAASALILFEFLAVPYPMEDGHVPEIYGKMAREPGDYAVLELPNYLPTMTYPDYMYYQTTHQKKLVNGYVSRTPDYAYEFSLMTPLIEDLIDLDRSVPFKDILNQSLPGIAQSVLGYYNIRYIIIHDDIVDYTYGYRTTEDSRISDEQLRRAMGILNASELTPRAYEGGSLIVYSVDKGASGSFMELRGGWYGTEYPDGQPTRWMKDRAEIRIFSDQDRHANLSMSAHAYHKPRTLEIYCSGKLCSRSAVSTDPGHIKTEISIKKGMNNVSLYMPEGCERPVDVEGSMNTDSRCLSLAISNVTVDAES